jgi:hypothetical protein
MLKVVKKVIQTLNKVFRLVHQFVFYVKNQLNCITLLNVKSALEFKDQSKASVKQSLKHFLKCHIYIKGSELWGGGGARDINPTSIPLPHQKKGF